MTSHPPHGRIRCVPISANPHHGLLSGLPPQMEPLSFVVGSHPLAPHGLLVRVRHNGNLAVWRGVRIEQVDQRKAQAALDMMDYA